MNHVRNILAALLIGATSVSNVFCAEPATQPGRIERATNLVTSAASATYSKGKELCTAENALKAALVVAGIYFGVKMQGKIDALQTATAANTKALNALQSPAVKLLGDQVVKTSSEK
jgi:hypothetical protein